MRGWADWSDGGDGEEGNEGDGIYMSDRRIAGKRRSQGSGP